MTTNILPSGVHDLMALAAQMARGLERHGPWVGITQVQAPEFRRQFDDLEMAEQLHATARAAKAKVSARVTAADEALTAWLGKARLVVMLARGAQWSESWLETGFAHRATNVPKHMAARMTVAAGVVKFFEQHPEFDVPFAGVTASDGRAALAEMRAAEGAVRAAVHDTAVKKRTRDDAEKLLHQVMRCMRALLALAISGDDARWLDFGLNRPLPNVKKPWSAPIAPSAEAVVEMPVPCAETTPMAASAA